MHFYIYLTYHVDGWTYVGKSQCRCLPEREAYWGSGIDIKKKRGELRTGWSRKILLQWHIDTTDAEVLKRHAETLARVEPHYINKYFTDIKNLNRTNKRWGGVFVLSDKGRAAISAASKRPRKTSSPRGKSFAPMSEQGRANISAANKGRVFSAEHRARLSAAKMGRSRTTSERAAISAGLKARAS